MGLSITGYIDLSLTEHQFRDMIEKDINGELTCIGSNKTDGKNLKNYERKARHVEILEKVVLTWNCSHAAEVWSTCHTSFENIRKENLGKYLVY